MLSYFVRLANTGVAGACQEVFHARLSFVAESIEVKAAILHSRSPSHCFSCVEDVDASHPADILVASPPCLLYSKANRHSTYADQMAEATRVIGELRRILGLLRPRLLILARYALPCCLPVVSGHVSRFTFYRLILRSRCTAIAVGLTTANA